MWTLDLRTCTSSSIASNLGQSNAPLYTDKDACIGRYSKVVLSQRSGRCGGGALRVRAHEGLNMLTNKAISRTVLAELTIAPVRLRAKDKSLSVHHRSCECLSQIM